MMMPANYSAIAENEMTYVVGGGVIEFLGSFTAPIFTVENLKTLNTNLVTIVGNTYMKDILANTLGLVFTGYTGNATWANIKANNVVMNIVNQGKNNGIGDAVASTLGTVAALYNLGRADVKNYANGNVLFANGSKL